nr:MAG TPA: hypothetical protein [Caudoviricetes sp.]
MIYNSLQKIFRCDLIPRIEKHSSVSSNNFRFYRIV